MIKCTWEYIERDNHDVVHVPFHGVVGVGVDYDVGVPGVQTRTLTTMCYLCPVVLVVVLVLCVVGT